VRDADGCVLVDFTYKAWRNMEYKVLKICTKFTVYVSLYK
jgi:hypothetical protein